VESRVGNAVRTGITTGITEKILDTCRLVGLVDWLKKEKKREVVWDK